MAQTIGKSQEKKIPTHKVGSHWFMELKKTWHEVTFTSDKKDDNNFILIRITKKFK